MILINTHNICFYGELIKIILQLSINSSSAYQKSSTVNNPKIPTPEKFAVIVLKVEQFDFMTE